MALIDSFQPEFPGAIVVPANRTNVLIGTNYPKVLVLHTPEEPADNYEVTPYYFQTANLSASTHYYSDNDGDMYQMVPESRGAIANGVLNKPYPASTNPSVSLNFQSLSIEIEGFASGIHITMPRGGAQWMTVVKWIELETRRYNIPLDRAHIIGHYEVASNRTDPGGLNIEALIEDALTFREENDMTLREDLDKHVKDFNNYRIWTTAVEGALSKEIKKNAAALEFAGGLLAVLFQKHADSPTPAELTEMQDVLEALGSDVQELQDQMDALSDGSR